MKIVFEDSTLKDQKQAFKENPVYMQRHYPERFCDAYVNYCLRMFAQR